MTLQRRFILGISCLLLLAAFGTASAEVYVTSPTTGRILVLDASGGVTRVLGEGGGMIEPYALSLDSQRNLLVADYAAGRVLRYSPDGSNASVVASNIPKADGLSVGAAGDLFLVSRDNSVTRSRLRVVGGDVVQQTPGTVWIVPAGTALPIQLGTVAESTRLAQTLQAAAPYQGDLLVLSTRPGFVARYVRSGPAEFTRSADLAPFVPGEPTSFGYDRKGELLVSTSDGRILRYSASGQRLQPDFAAGLPAGATRLSINYDGVVHLTRSGSPVVTRFDPYGMRLADLTGPTAPVAAALTDGCVPTPAGTNVTVSPAAGVNVIFDQVLAAGQTCLVTTSLEPGVRTTPSNNTIPDFANKLFEDPGFVVYDLKTTAQFADSIATEFFSYHPDARLLHASGSGNVMADMTTLVTPDDPRGRVGSFSEFVVYLDTRPAAEVVLLKLASLQAQLAEAESRIGGDIFDALQMTLGDVSFLVGQAGSDADRLGAIQELTGLKAFVRQNSGEGIPNTPGADGGANDAGDLISFADTLIFQLTL